MKTLLKIKTPLVFVTALIRKLFFHEDKLSIWTFFLISGTWGRRHLLCCLYQLMLMSVSASIRAHTFCSHKGNCLSCPRTLGVQGRDDARLCWEHTEIKNIKGDCGSIQIILTQIQTVKVSDRSICSLCDCAPTFNAGYGAYRPLIRVIANAYNTADWWSAHWACDRTGLMCPLTAHTLITAITQQHAMHLSSGMIHTLRNVCAPPQSSAPDTHFSGHDIIVCRPGEWRFLM